MGRRRRNAHQSTQTKKLTNPSFELILDPARGGRWTRLRANINRTWTDVLWTAPKDRAKNPFASAAYVMAPWCNRVAGSEFHFQNERFALRPNFPDGTAIHGDVYDRRWAIKRASASRLTTSLDTRHFPDFNFPFPLLFRQDVRIGSRMLQWSLRIKNLSSRAAPVGFGLHPFFLSCIDGHWGELAVPADRVYPSKNAVATGDPRPVKGPTDLRRPVPLHGRRFDACYTNIRGPITMRFPGLGWHWSLELGPGMNHVYLYTPPFRKDVICIEPMSLSVDGFNRFAHGKKDSGVCVLKPGAAWESYVKITATE